MKEIRIRAFRATDDLESCIKFAEGHRAVLENYGVPIVNSAKPDWFSNPNIFVIVAESMDKSKIYGGAKLHLKDKHGLLPMEKALEKLDKKIIDLVNKYSIDGTGEFCGLWNSREVAGLGVSSVFLVRAGVARAGCVIADQLNINSLFAFCASYTVPIAQKVGFSVEMSVGDEGTFNYPTSDMVAVVTILKDLKTLSFASNAERELINNLRENPHQKRIEVGPKGPMQVMYDLFILNSGSTEQINQFNFKK